MLYIVGTPIGNLGDISGRALEALREVDIIAAEDTRVTRKLLAHFDVHTRLISHHEHNQTARLPELMEMLRGGSKVALVSDAGMPAISDPGWMLVDAARSEGIQVLCVPGPSAVTAAISASGYDAREFAFYGFLPRNKKELHQKLSEIHMSDIKIFVAYESPHRMTALLKALLEIMPEANACIFCDITKFYEKSRRGSISELLEELKNDPNAKKGEYCIVVQDGMKPVPAAISEKLPPEAEIFMALLEGSGTKDAMERAVMNGHKKNQAYDAMLRVKKFILSFEEE